MFKKFRFLILGLFSALTIVALVLSFRVNINYDVSQYLPSDSKVSESLEKMEEEFGMNGNLLVLVRGAEPNQLVEMLSIENVEMVTYQEAKTEDDKEEVLLRLILEKNDYSSESQEVVKQVISSLDGKYEYYLYGQAYLTYSYNDMINTEIPKIILFIIPLVLLILILTTTSFIDPLIFIIVSLVSVLINMGTNAFLPSVSYMTSAIGGILQFALCMDYSIILISLYQQHKEKDNSLALSNAWKASLIPILSASLTTVAGFVAIMFMKYKIGLDIGIVLAKGVIITLITVIFLMPVLLILFDKLREKTKHKNYIKIFKGFKTFLYKTRYVLPVIAVIIIGGAAYLQTKNVFTYSDNTVSAEGKLIKESKEQIEKNFTLTQSGAILIKNDVDTNEIIDEIKNLDLDIVISISSFDYKYDINEIKEVFSGYGYNIDTNTLYFMYSYLGVDKLSLSDLYNLGLNLKKELSVEDMEVFMNYQIEKSLLQTIYSSKSAEVLTILDVLETLNEIQNQKMPKEQMAMIFNIDINILNTVYQILQTEETSIKELMGLLNSEFTSDEVKYFITSVDSSLIDNVYLQMQNNGIIENNKTTILNLVNFIIDNYSPYLTTDNINELTLIKSNMEKTSSFSNLDVLTTNLPLLSTIDVEVIKNSFVGDNYQRIVFELLLEEENEKSFTYFTDLNSLLSSEFTDYYLVSSSYSILDIKNVSENDYRNVTIISIVLILIIIAISFKSIIIPIILIFIIEGAIFINMSIPVLTNQSLFYVGFLIVGCIQLGATIDYGILLASRYKEMRKSSDKEESLSKAIDESFPSILTSGFILAVCGLMLSFFSSVQVIAVLGRLIGIGSLISMVMTCVILPQMLAVFDKIIIKKIN